MNITEKFQFYERGKSPRLTLNMLDNLKSNSSFEKGGVWKSLKPDLLDDRYGGEKCHESRDIQT